jgi:biotin carboxyl carrier protein
MSAGDKIPAASAAGIQIEINGGLRRLDLSQSPKDGEWRGTLDGEPFEIDARLVQPGILSLIVHGRAYRCVLDEGPIETAIQIFGERYLVSLEDPRSLAARRRKTGASGGLQIIKAPMPGRIVRLLAAVGDQVSAHQGVVVIEAMKMQNELKAVRAGKVVEIKVEAGSTVSAGEVLLVIE